LLPLQGQSWGILGKIRGQKTGNLILQHFFAWFLKSKNTNGSDKFSNTFEFEFYPCPELT
jgi:hypothetical protein